MAKIGLENFRYGILTENNGSVSYGNAKKPGKAISCTVDIESNDVSLYADNTLAESDKSFSKGTVKIGIDEDDNVTMADLLGHEIVEEYVATEDTTKQNGKKYYTKSGTTYTEFTGSSFATGTTYYEKSSNAGEMIRNANDIAPYVGLGRVITKKVNGALKYKVEFLCKVKFGEPSQENNTKGETIEFGTTELEGTISALEDGTWSKAKTFDSKSEAVAYLEGLFAA